MKKTLKSKLGRVFTSFASFLLLVNSFAPYSVAVAQEMVPTDTPIVESTIAPEVIQTEILSSPKDSEPTAEPTVEPTAEPTIEPTTEPTVEPTPEVVLTSETPSPVPPETTPEVTPEILSSEAPTPTVSVENDLAPPVEITATVLDNKSAPSVLNLLDEIQITSEPSATLVTDKADYAPTDSVLITGSGFTSDTAYTIYITTPTGDFSFSDTVTSDSSGNLLYTYQLDGTYRPDYTVEIKLSDSVIASTTFTDSRTITSVTLDGGSKTTVSPSSTISVSITVDTSGQGDRNWKSTGWLIEGGSWTCEDTPDHTSSGNHTESLNITAPINSGIYNVGFQVYKNDNCDSGGSEIYTLVDGITVSQSAVCGNGILTTGEACDDGNTNNGDGCSSTCQVEQKWSCSGQPSICHIGNPSLTNSCGLDIALLADVSTSIDSTELGQMKTALTNFVNAFTGTPTVFSLSRFGTVGEKLNDFSMTPAQAAAAVGSLSPFNGTQYTNWDDGLAKAFGTFDPRTDKPNLIVIATDGNPNKYSNPAQPSGNNQDAIGALAAAITRANTIKGNTRIVAIGIGGDLNTTNLQAITGSVVAPPATIDENVDVITSNFDTLGAEMANLATGLCGGTVNITKKVDGVVASGWTFTPSVTGGTADLLSDVTDGNGQVSFAIDPTNGSATVDVAETVQTGYSLSSVVCIKNNQPITPAPTYDSDSVNGLVVGVNDIVACTFNNHLLPQTGSISGHKFEDLNGNHNQETNEPMISHSDIPGGVKIFIDTNDNQVWDSNEVNTYTDNNGYYHFTNLSPAPYDVCEVVPAGWQVTFPDGTNCHLITVHAGEDVLYDFGNFEKGTVYANKYEDLDGVLGRTDGVENWIGDPTFTFRLYKVGDPNWSLVGQADTDSTGRATFDHVMDTIGNYRICEVMKAGWEDMRSLNNQANNQSGAADEYPVCEGITVGTSGYIVYSDFGNIQLMDIHGYKWNDINGDGTDNCQPNRLFVGDSPEPICEPKLAGWTIFIDGNLNGILDPGERSMVTSDQAGPHYGWYWFEDLVPGEYRVCEVTQTGWQQTYPATCHTVTLPYLQEVLATYAVSVNYLPDPTPELNFGNRFIASYITLTKTNDAAGDKSPGDAVTFTLTLTISENDLDNVRVFDSPAAGFKYRSGSWTATINGGTFAIAEPDYSSGVGAWNLGDLHVGDVVVMSYLADIDGNQSAGLYSDLAWADGTSLIGDNILANASSDPLYFVGTRVNVVRSTQDSAQVNVIHQERVLGASTQLPSTGSNTLWLIIAGILATLGFGLVIASKHRALSVVLGVAVTLGILMVPASVNAFVIPGFSLTVSQPKTPTNQDNFRLTFVALDIDTSHTVSVSCQKQSPSDGSPVQFATVSLPNGGGSSYCLVESPILSAPGTYLFRVVASNSVDTITKDVSLSFNAEHPWNPNDYRKEQLNSCDYRITFKTADDNGRTDSVELYRSDKTSFTADSGTRVSSQGIGSNQAGQFTNTVPDCNKNYYFAIRAFNASGNGSDVVGDSQTETIIVNPTGTTTSGTSGVSGAIPVSGADITGEVTEPSQGPSVMGESIGFPDESATPAGQGQGWAWWKIAGVGLLGAGLVYLFFFRRKEQNNP
jgi:LPXTG-motif cell wall-anchored protein